MRATIERRETINVPQRPRTLPRAARSVTHAAPMRLLGRVDELDLLNQVLTATRDGGSDLVMIEGELGSARRRCSRPRLAISKPSVSAGGAVRSLVLGIPYAALALALREVLGTSTVDVRDFPALAGVFPEMRVRSSRAAPRTVDALESLIALVEALRPLVLVLDDLHWADSDTLVALDYLSSRGPLRGVTVAGAFRPEEIDTGHRVARLRPTMRIRLGPLEEHDLACLEIPDLYHRSEGHPQFVSLAVATDEGGKLARSQWVANRCRAEGEPALRLLSAACSAGGVVLGFAAGGGTRAADGRGRRRQLDRLCTGACSHSDAGATSGFAARSMREAMAESLAGLAGLLEQRIARDGAPTPCAADAAARGCPRQRRARSPRRSVCVAVAARRRAHRPAVDLSGRLLLEATSKSFSEGRAARFARRKPCPRQPRPLAARATLLASSPSPSQSPPDGAC